MTAYRFEDLAPAVKARMDAELEHQRDCTAESCERCGRYPAIDEPTPEQLAETRRAAWQALAVESIPLAFRGVTLASPWLGRLVGAQALEQARAGTTSARAAFVGPPGAGKTSLAVAMLRAALDAAPPVGRRCDARYVTAYALAKARAGHPLGQGDPPLLTHALRCSLLVLDELGAENAAHASAVTEVIHERHAAALPTWITTGVAPAELAERYGGGIARRVFEGATVFRLVGRTR